MKKRKTNRAKTISNCCKNNGSCTYCSGNRLHQSKKEIQKALDKYKDFFDYGIKDGFVEY